MKVICAQCGTEFEAESAKARFCSGACRTRSNRGLAPTVTSTVTSTVSDTMDAPCHSEPVTVKKGLPAHLTPEALRPIPLRWEKDLPKNEVDARLQRMKDYNRSMRRIGMHHHIMTRKDVEQMLAKAGYDWKLASVAEPREAGPYIPKTDPSKTQD